MITEQKIAENKNRFLELVNGIMREGIDKESLIAQLEGSDFFVAPASTVYHCSYRGGLCQHCLNVYDQLKNVLASQYIKTLVVDEEGQPCIDEQGNSIYEDSCPYSEDTIRIVALFHDFSKMNFYETFVKNVKVYSDTGSKYDEMGKFDWVAETAYKIREPEQRFIFGGHEETALYMAQTFIPMSIEEQVAILHHMGGMSNDSDKAVVPTIFNKYKLAVYLHTADMLSTYVSDLDA